MTNTLERLRQSSQSNKESKIHRATGRPTGELTFADIGDVQQRFAHLSAEHVTSYLASIVEKCRGREKHFYEKVRRHYCALNIALNIRFVNGENGAAAPAYRPQLKRTNMPNDVESILSNDLQVIDFHLIWLLEAAVIRKTDPDYFNAHARDAASGSEFEFDEAFRFAATSGEVDKKLDYLGIKDDHFTQWQLVVLKSEVVGRRRDLLEKRKGTAARKLARQSYRNHNLRGNENVWAEIWAAAETLAISCKQCKPKEVEEIFRMRTGKADHTAAQVMRKLASARRYLS